MTDILIVGGGLAGWRAADAAVAAGCKVTVIANGDGNSPHIHALNCPVLEGDSAERMFDDTMSSGHGENDPILVRVLCDGAVSLKDEFSFDRDENGEFKTIQPLGSSMPRCVSIGHSIGRVALAEIKNRLSGKVDVVSGRVTDIRKTQAAFEVALESCGWMSRSFRAVVIATGGWCGKYDFSTNPRYLRGDGIGLAQSLGAAVRDMDAVQYEPTVRVCGERRGIPVITTLLHRGARLRNRDGAELVADARMNKDEISRLVLDEMRRTGERGVWYDLRAVAKEDLLACNMDPDERMILVAPAPHTSLGGVVIDERCRVLGTEGTCIAGLFAAGEVTGGVHGKNRLGGNAGTEVLVFGRIAGNEAAKFAKEEW